MAVFPEPGGPLTTTRAEQIKGFVHRPHSRGFLAGEVDAAASPENADRCARGRVR